MDFNDHIKYYDDGTKSYNYNTFACTTCGLKFPPKPKYPNLYDPLTRQPYNKSELDIVLGQYRKDLYEWESGVADHLLTHPMSQCQFCQSVVKKTTLRAHQKSFACSVARRKQIMDAKGYVDIHEQYRLLMQCANHLFRKMLHATSQSHETFDNEELRDYLEEELSKSKRTFRQLAGIRLAYTSYNKVNPTLEPDHPSQGWQLHAWAPRETVVAIKEVLKKWNKLPQKEQTIDVKMEAYTRMWEWLLSDEDARFAAIGLWELADAPL